MNKKLIIMLLANALIAGCASGVIYKKPPTNAPSDDASIKLAEAANSVSDSMIDMARIEKTITPPNKDTIHFLIGYDISHALSRLKAAFRYVMKTDSYRMDALVVLPDHLHGCRIKI